MNRLKKERNVLHCVGITADESKRIKDDQYSLVDWAMPLSLESSEKTLKKDNPPLTKEKKYATKPLEKKVFRGQKGWYTQQKSCAKS